MDQVKVFAPATVSNVACGFDIMGFPLEGVGDTLFVSKTDEPGLTISKVRGPGGLPTDPARNVITIAAQALLDHHGGVSQGGFQFKLTKQVKPGSGLGSSGSSATSSVFAINELLGRPYSKMDLLPFAMAGEAAVSGQPHADNIAPSMLGGFVLIRGYDPLDVVRLDYPAELYCSVVHPQIEIKTSDSRNLLNTRIDLRDAVTQWGNVGGLVSGLAKGDYELISRSLKDVIAEPVRSRLIPMYHEAKQEALDMGALGANISGSGPSIFALSSSRSVAERVGKCFKELYAKMPFECNVYVSQISAKGAEVVG